MTNGRVVVLGTTGKNFAAGMSGGIAYVVDETGDFSTSLCNREMVDLEALDADDIAFVRHAVQRHCDLTGSPRAKTMLAQWPQYVLKFVKVFPHDYKRVLAMAAKGEKQPARVAKEAVVG